MSIRLTLILALTAFSLSGQYQYHRLNHTRSLRIEKPLYNLDVDMHTSIRPLDLWEVDSLDPEVRKWDEELAYDYDGWLWRKMFNEHLVSVEGDGYSFIIDPIVNFRGGFDTEMPEEVLFVNTRGFNIEGQLGRNFSFRSSYLENQARFPEYINDFSNAQNVVPGQGYAREFKETGFDFGMASGQVSYTPNDIFSFTLGQGRNFFGEGYRSMLLSDNSFNYPFFRIETSFWKVKYVNLWAQMYDVRDAISPNNIFAKKHLSSHYLSINITPRWNLSVFEAVVFGDTTQQRGMDVSFFNPVIFYRPVEFAVGSRTGNALLGMASSYKIWNGTQTYAQFVLDEFSLESFTAREGGWQNKYSWQLGVKSFDAFRVEGLFARLEYNASRPYTYSHKVPLMNYAHYGQSLAHPWGANFHEGLLHLVYQRGRWEVQARYHFGLVGLDTAGSDWGADIYQSYNNRERDIGNEVGQGMQGKYQFLQVNLAWLVNPVTGLKLEAGAQIRSMNTAYEPTTPLPAADSRFFYFGLRTEFFNRYYDF